MSAAWVRYETRRAGWASVTASPAVLACGVLIAAALAAKGGESRVFVQFWLREVVPLAFGLAVAGVPAAETCLQTQLSLPTPIVRTLARRVALCVLVAALATVACALAAAGTHRWHPAHGLLVGQLTWLSPSLALASAAALAFALSGSTAGAAATVAGLWLVEDLTPLWFSRYGWSRSLYLYLDDTAGTHGMWWTNRLCLLAVASVLFVAASVLLNLRQERVFAARLADRSE